MLVKITGTIAFDGSLYLASSSPCHPHTAEIAVIHILKQPALMALGPADEGTRFAVVNFQQSQGGEVPNDFAHFGMDRQTVE